MELADALFTVVQQRVLRLLYGEPDRRFQSGELIRLVASGTGAVHRVLTRLTSAGLVTAERVGNRKYYQANRACPAHHALCSLVEETLVQQPPAKDVLSRRAFHGRGSKAML